MQQTLAAYQLTDCCLPRAVRPSMADECIRRHEGVAGRSYGRVTIYLYWKIIAHDYVNSAKLRKGGRSLPFICYCCLLFATSSNFPLPCILIVDCCILFIEFDNYVFYVNTVCTKCIAATTTSAATTTADDSVATTDPSEHSERCIRSNGDSMKLSACRMLLRVIALGWLRSVRYGSTNQANSAFHPFVVDR